MQKNISLEEATSLMLQDIIPLGTEFVPLASALGRSLAEDLTANCDQPPFDRSPLDGYALRSADLVGATPANPALFKVVDTVYAGDVTTVSVGQGEAVCIMTGAMLPIGCDCVLRQEDTDRGFPLMAAYQSLRPFENYCYRGEDYRNGEQLISAGTQLDAAALGVLASAGLSDHLPVRRRPRVAVLSTGNELTDPCEAPLPAGKIYDANLSLLTARLRELGMNVVSGERVEDNLDAMVNAMRQLLNTCDLLITTGGVSVGAKDIFHQALPVLGAEQIFWRVKLKPGSPAMFSRYQGKPILSLSGNPFAAAATFELLARPLLAALSGEPQLLPQRGTGALLNGFQKSSPGRRFLRGRYENGFVTLPDIHNSGILSSLIGCNCLVELPAGTGPLAAGTTVSLLLI